MKKRVHMVAGSLGLALITTFFISSVLVELFGDDAAIAQVKRLILIGIVVLVPSMMITGASGQALRGARRGPRILIKQRRMIAIAATGLLVLVPSAITLDRLASAGTFDTTFTLIQIVELVGGAVNITLMGLNFRDGLLLTGRIRRRPRSPLVVHS